MAIFGLSLFGCHYLHDLYTNYISVLLLVVLGFVILVSNIKSVTYIGSSHVWIIMLIISGSYYLITDVHSQLTLLFLDTHSINETGSCCQVDWKLGLQCCCLQIDVINMLN